MKIGPSENMSKKALGAAILLLLLALGLGNAHALEVLIRDQVSIKGATVCLGDIASFEPAEDARVSQLQQVHVASAPPPGRKAVLNNRLIIHKLSAALADMDDIRVKLPVNLLVHREAQVISAEKLRDMFKNHILENAPWPEGRVEFEQINVPGSVMLPLGNVQTEIRNRKKDDYEGDISLVVSFWVDGVAVRKIPLKGRVYVKQTVVKPVRKIEAGEVLKRGDLVLVEEKRIHVKRDIVTRLDQIVNKTAVRRLEPGRIITLRMIEAPPLVRKGERVIIKAENEQVRVTAVGRVLEDGGSGEQVRVVNIMSGKEISATVQGAGILAVAF
jgi:flagella basal body P-ring formation protein FlgA